MRLSFNRSDLKWYQYGWAIIPLALGAAGGIVGGLCGGAAAAVNLYFMRGKQVGWKSYVLTGIISASAAAAYVLLVHVFNVTVGVKLVTEQSVDRDLQKMPIYTALKKVDPADYEKIVKQLANAPLQSDSASALVREVIGNRLSHAGDQAVVDAARVLALQLDQIGAKSADACINFLFPQPGKVLNLRQYLTNDVVHLDETTTVAVLETSVDPKPIPVKQDVAAAINAVRGRLVATYGEDAVVQLGTPKEMDHGKLCSMTSSLYKEALSLPRQQSVSLLRVLFAQKSSL